VGCLGSVTVTGTDTGISAPGWPEGPLVSLTVGFEGGRSGSEHIGAIGEIFGVYGQALTEGNPPMA
jgi:hypothetical protein